ncbi:hypothetical protein V8J88_18180 [Massilia sp. W12]|uniref:hypothetical protein n=1 Tax=Massilia sp. W12 TaxID=3126507 RepID=UPI0030D1C174
MKAIAHMEAWFLSCAAVAVAGLIVLEHPQFSAAEHALPATVQMQAQMQNPAALPDA